MITKVMIATPVYSDVTLEYMQSILNLKDFYLDKNVELKFEFTSGNSIIHDARNQLSDRFLKSNCDYLFFIDSDMVFEPSTFDEILSVSQENDKHIVAAVCPKREINWEFLYYAIKKGEKDIFNYNSIFNHTFNFDGKEVDLTKPIEINDIGTGFMCIKREVFEELTKKITKKYKKSINSNKIITAFFDFGILPQSKQFIGEDIYFCRTSKYFGFRIWMCPWLLVGHKGDYIYTGTFNKSFELYKKYITSGDYKQKKISYKN